MRCCRLESRLFSGDGDWRELLDEAAAIDYFLLVEITKNPDGYRGSTYMSKVRCIDAAT